jgi:hypothetical protein
MRAQGIIDLQIFIHDAHLPQYANDDKISTLEVAHEIFFAIFNFAGSFGIDDAMFALARAGMKINGVLDRLPACCFHELCRYEGSDSSRRERTSQAPRGHPLGSTACQGHGKRAGTAWTSPAAEEVDSHSVTQGRL